jgi:hypothetical protein
LARWRRFAALLKPDRQAALVALKESGLELLGQTNAVLWVNVSNLKKLLTLFGRRIIQIQVVPQFTVLAGLLEHGWA